LCHTPSFVGPLTRPQGYGAPPLARGRVTRPDGRRGWDHA
jgi:hypothetical protein